MHADTNSQPSVLVVEDEPELGRLLQLNLTPLGFEVDVALDLGAARRALRARERALVILDLTLPDGDGLDLCRELRQRQDYTPILILTARANETDRVVGLELGADDYLVKPFAIRELTARVKAILRRVDLAQRIQADPNRRLVVDDLVVDPASRRVSVGERRVDLTATEFDLLLQLAGNPGRVYTRTQLLDLVWGDSFVGQEHTVNTHVNRLRDDMAAARTSMKKAEDFIRDLEDDSSGLMSGISTKMPLSKRLDIFRGFMGAIVDFRTMARFVLGRHGKRISKAEFKEFLNYYEALFLNGYTYTRGDVWDGQIDLKQVRPYAKDYLVTVTLRPRKGGSDVVGLRIRRHPGSFFDFKVIDVLYKGVSLLVTQRADFGPVLNKAGLPGLIAEIEKKVGYQEDVIDIPD